MDNNLPGSPPNQGNNNPPPFGSDFNPHSNPQDPNNSKILSEPVVSRVEPVEGPYHPSPPNYPPVVSEVEPNNPEEIKHEHYSEVAQEKPRDEHGRFVPTPDMNTPTTPIESGPTIPQPQIPTPQPPSNPSPPSNSSSFSEKIKSVWNFFSKNYKKIGIALSFIYLVAMNPSFQNFAAQFSPNSSPVLFRGVNYSGILKTSDNGLFMLVLPDSSTYTLHLKPSNTLANFKNYHEVIVKGNLSWIPFVIENAEIYPLNVSTSSGSDTTETKKPSTKTNSTPSNLSDSSSSSLPTLYSKLTWEVTQSKTLIFTSGKRKIEQEGVYLESAQVTDYPQDFIDYYTNELTNLGFKQTFNSSEPSGTTVTFANDNLFLTFGVKNTFSGTGDNKQSLRPDGLKKISGYKAFIEHN